MKQQSCQDVFLNVVRKNKHPVTIFLSNGIKLQGIITGFDNFAIILRRDSHMQLVYKHSISTIMPTGALSLQDSENIIPEQDSTTSEDNNQQSKQ